MFRIPPTWLSTVTVAGGVLDGRLAGLTALRDVLAEQIDECDSKRDLASLSQRLMDVLEQIELVERAAPVVKGTALDEFTKRRAARSAAGAPGSAKRQQRGG